MRMHDRAYIRREAEQHARIDSLEAEVTCLRAEVERLRFTAAERDALVTLCGDSSKWANPHVQLLLQYLERNKLLGSTEPRA